MSSVLGAQMTLAAYAIARPQLVTRIVPKTLELSVPTANTVVEVLRKYGPAYSSPGPLLEMAAEAGLPVDEEDFVAINAAVPDTDADELITSSAVTDLVVIIQRAATEERVGVLLRRAADKLERGDDPAMVYGEVRTLLDEHQQMLTGAGSTVIEKLRDPARMKTRWKLGYEGIDDLFPGLGSDRKPSSGALAQKELVMLVAASKVGKTRMALAWMNALLDQGARILLIILEDDDTTYALKLMAERFDIPKWFLEFYFAGFGYVGTEAQKLEYQGRARAAEAWWTEMEASGQIRVIDGTDSHDIFNFRRAVEIIESDADVRGTTHVMIDYVQAWAAKDQAEGMVQAFTLRATAQRKNVNVIALSQISNQTMREGAAEGQLPAKGAGDWGAAAHVGFWLKKDWGSSANEQMLDMVIARDAAGQPFFVQFNPFTGHNIKYTDTPEWAFQDLLSEDTPPKKQRTRSKR